MTDQPLAAVCLICQRPQTTYDVCPKCQDRLDAQLSEVGKLHALIEASPSMLLGGSSHASRPGSDDPNPGDLDAMNATDPRCGPLFTLASWASLFRDDFELRMPAKPEPMSVVVKFLRSQLARIAQHEAADEFAREVRDSLRLLREVVYGVQHRRINLGECPVVIPATDFHDAYACRAGLFADPEASTLSCGKCRTVWTFEQWEHLAALLAS